jgi:cytoskeletal protein CcmA (bactofilin family)
MALAMAMFDRPKNKSAAPPPSDSSSTKIPSKTVPATTPRSTAMIGPSITIKGEVTGEEDLLIQGKVEGTINLKNQQVSVGDSGAVTANIVARVITVDGQVTGDIAGSEKVVVSQSGNVKGNIIAPRVTLEDGAIFKGSIDMDPGESAKDKSSLTSQAPANSSVPELDLKSG